MSIACPPRTDEPHPEGEGCRHSRVAPSPAETALGLVGLKCSRLTSGLTQRHISAPRRCNRSRPEGFREGVRYHSGTGPVLKSASRASWPALLRDLSRCWAVNDRREGASEPAGLQSVHRP